MPMERGTDSAMQSGTEVWRQARNQPCTQACTEGATQPHMEANTEPGTQGSTEAPQRLARCPLGYSWLQVAILSVLASPHHVLAYQRIAAIVQAQYRIKATAGAVRGAMERLSRYNLFVGKPTARGHLKGNRYAFMQEPCPYIIRMPSVLMLPTVADMETTMHLHTQAGSPPALSLLEEKERIQNLSLHSYEPSPIQHLEALTEDDIVFHWPLLAQAGFGTHQVRQIISRLAQVALPANNVMQGLMHAEWELEHNQMRDKNGAIIQSPVKWVFKILATQGYYPRPAQYISPQEQAEQDAQLEALARSKAQENRFASEFTLWAANLSQSEKQALVQPQNGRSLHMPEDVTLRNYFRAQVWQKPLNGGA